MLSRFPDASRYKAPSIISDWQPTHVPSAGTCHVFGMCPWFVTSGLVVEDGFTGPIVLFNAIAVAAAWRPKCFFAGMPVTKVNHFFRYHMHGESNTLSFELEGLHDDLWRPVRAALWGIALFTLLLAAPSSADELKPETLQAWQQYVDTVNARNQQHLVPGSSFLSIDE